MSTTIINFHATTDAKRTRITAIAGGVQRWAVVPAGHDHLIGVAITGLTENYRTLLQQPDLVVAPDFDSVMTHAEALREHFATMLTFLQFGNLAIEVDSPDRLVTDEERADAMQRAGWVTAERIASTERHR